MSTVVYSMTRTRLDGDALVYEVAPHTAFGFGKGDTFSQTRWRFS